MSYGNSLAGYVTYREIGVKTASQGKLVVMLYEGAISNLDKAIALVKDGGKIAAGDIENYGNYLQKAMDIIAELEASLNMDEGGDIARNLMSLYVFFNKRILSATMSHDAKELSDVRGMLGELKDSWVAASNSAANAKTTAAFPAVSVTG